MAAEPGRSSESPPSRWPRRVAVDGSGIPASGAVPPATGDLLGDRATSLGTILVGGNGRTVYEFANDKDGASTGTGACAANWPFVPAPASVPASLLGVAGRLGTTTRSDGPAPG